MTLNRLHLCCLVSGELPYALEEFLPPDRYDLSFIEVQTPSTVAVDLNADCLVIFDQGVLPEETFLPTVLVVPSSFSLQATLRDGVILLREHALGELPTAINQAISQFIAFPTSAQPTSAIHQQRRLSEKLKERLGYLGVYYKRNPNQFLRSMPEAERQNYLDKLRETYEYIVLEYFKKTPDHLNQKIDEFASMAFLADVSVSQVLEIHMNLMDELSKKLRIEGHKDEILLDYRITLIDVIAHLCEMYRRSIPPKAGVV